jgi:general secretion pathway protein M
MSALTQLRTQAISRWQALSPREQRGVSVLGALLAVLLFYSVAISPALNTLRDSDNRRAQIGQQQAHMLACKRARRSHVTKRFATCKA